MLLVTGVEKGEILVPIIISIGYGSMVSTQKLTSNSTELTRSRNFKKHTALNINMRKSRLLLAISGRISLRKTVIPSEAMLHWKTVVPSKASPLFASANPDLTRIKWKIIRRGESQWGYPPIIREWCNPPFTRKQCYPPFTYWIDVIQTSTAEISHVLTWTNRAIPPK